MDRTNPSQPNQLQQQQLYYQQENMKYMNYHHSPFIQSYTPLVSPVLQNVGSMSLHNFTQLESPALKAQNNFEFKAPDLYILSPPRSFQLNPQTDGQMPSEFTFNNSPYINSSAICSNYPYVLEKRVPITPSQLLLLNEEEQRSHATADNSKEYLKLISFEEPYVSKKSHKEAEQKRRDTLKNAFKACKAVLPPMKEKAPSKVQVLYKARDFILDLKHENELINDYIIQLEAYAKELKNVAGSSSNGLRAPVLDRRARTNQYSDEEND